MSHQMDIYCVINQHEISAETEFDIFSLNEGGK